MNAERPTKLNLVFSPNAIVFGVSLVGSLVFTASASAQKYQLSSAMNAEWAAYVSAELQAAAGVEQNHYQAPEHTLTQALRAAITNEINTTLKLSSDNALRLNIQDSFSVGKQSLAALSVGAAQRNTFAPTVVHQLNSGMQLALGGIFTYDTFSNTAFGVSDRKDLYGQESASGSSVFVGFETPAHNGWSANVNGRSKTKMDAFRSYRGVFAEAGQFDLPARLSMGLSYQFSPQLRLDGNVDRVGFSDIRPFTSDLMPEAFVALLGDSNSPTFAWSDLTVYRAQLQWTPEPNQLLQLGWYSSEQPAPTNDRLRRALRDEFSNGNVQLSYGLGFARNAHFKFSASYAEGGYFFGPSLLQARDYQPGRQLEAEALVRLDF